MKPIQTRALLAAVIAAGLLAGCSHSDSDATKTDGNAATTQAQSSAPYNPNTARSQAPPQFTQQGQPGTGQSGAPAPKTSN